MRAADGDWSGIHLHVFDVPQATGDLYQRLASLDAWLHDHPQARIRVIAQTPVKNREHITAALQTIEQQGGEGLMLREPNQPYRGGRSPYLLKVKSAPDAECTVIAHHPGKGKHAGRLGAITCENEHGRFRIGSGFSDAEREQPPADQPQDADDQNLREDARERFVSLRQRVYPLIELMREAKAADVDVTWGV